ncbi:MAG: pyridoxamine 5'-phosphate oxidase family protein [Acidimicrobiales bacterium]
MQIDTRITDQDQVKRITKAIGGQAFAVLSTVSDAGFPHAAGIAYDSVGSTMFVHTMRSARKTRNIATNDKVAIVIPVRKLPVGPPFTIHFQGRAAILDMDDPEIGALVKGNQLGTIAGHGALEEPDGCFLKIEATGVVHSYGIGVSTLGLIRDPLHAGARSVRLEGV